MTFARKVSRAMYFSKATRRGMCSRLRRISFIRHATTRKIRTMTTAASKYTSEQRAWCETYQRETGFAPMMDQFERGDQTFDEAAWRSIRWYEAHTSDAHL